MRRQRTAPRRLLLHIGMGKTGTSALQVALVRNRDRLADAGIDYPAHPSDAAARADGVTNGNGAALADLLGSELAIAPVDLRRARSGLRALCEETAGSRHRTTLYSSELLYRLDPEHLAVLITEAERAGIELRVVAYLRDIAPYFFSAYSERVKRNGLAASFEEYLGGADDFARRVTLFQPRIRRLLECAGAARVQVLHYDSVRTALFAAFARDVLELTDTSGWAQPPTSVNRGLSAREFAVLRYVNAGCAGARWSGDVLITDAAAGSPAGVSRRELELLEARFASEVAWLNATLLHGRMTVAGDVRVLDEQEPTATLSRQDQAVLDRLIAAVRDPGRPGQDRTRLIAEVRDLLADPVRS